MAYRLVSQAAQVLQNTEQGTAQEVERRFEAVLRRIEREANRDGSLQGALRHFLKVTASYRPRLFHTYRLPGLPRTNNELEQFFGSARYHERRIAGRKVASPSTVIRGQVRLVAASAPVFIHPQGPTFSLAASPLGVVSGLGWKSGTRHDASNFASAVFPINTWPPWRSG